MNLWFLMKTGYFKAMKGPWTLCPRIFGLYIGYCCTYAIIDVFGFATRKKKGGWGGSALFKQII